MQWPSSSKSSRQVSTSSQDVNATPETAEIETDHIRDVELILVAFRGLLLLFLILAPSILHISEAYTAQSVGLIIVASVYNFAMGVASLQPSRFGVRRPLVLAMDTTLMTAWLHFSHRWELIPFYYVVVVVAAMWYRVFGGLLAATICNFLFLLLWGRQAAAMETTTPPQFTSAMAINATLFFVVGALAGYIAEAQERERERRLERELLIANYQQEIDLSGELQPTLIQPMLTRHRALDIGVATHTARSFGGGDYLDVIVPSENRVLLCVADVAGKSVRAQARVPLLKYSLRALAPLNEEPQELMARLQETLAPDLSHDLYIALCLIQIDLETETISWCNAGHIAPLVLSGDKIHCLETTGPAVGLFPEIVAEQSEIDLPAESVFVLYTDGLTDALSLDGSADGEAQVQKLAQHLLVASERPAAADAQQLVDLAVLAIEDESFIARNFELREKLVNSKVHRDDIAVMVLKSKSLTADNQTTKTD